MFLSFAFDFISRDRRRFLFMASSTTVRAPCATCGVKAGGIFKCEGCGQIFCRKHVIEHRDTLSQQLDEIVLEYDGLQQTVAEGNGRIYNHHPLIEQIDRWETESIEKIRLMANEARQQVKELTGSPTGKQEENHSSLYLYLIY